MKRPFSLSFFFYSCFLCSCLVLPVFAQPPQTNPSGDAYKATLDHLQSLITMPMPEWRSHADVPHPEDAGLNDADWQTVKVHEEWETGPRVVRRWIEVPDKIDGYSTDGARVDLNLVIRSSDALILTVFSNGGIVYRGDEDMEEPIPLTQSARAGEKFLVAVRIDCSNAKTGIFESELTIRPPSNRPDPSRIRMEMLSAQPVIGAYEDGKAERQQQLDAAVTAIDFSPLEHGDQAGFDRSLNDAQAKLALLKPYLQQFKIHAVGNSHIDMAWLWPWTETVEVVRNTFQSVLDLMREYPDFTFTMSSARTYEWIEEKYPDMFKQIAERVREGRWEVIGGMWVEPDLNMPDGESLTRQVLVGKRYFQSRFGVDVKIGWNPDSFGYNWQLPQIYKKSGMDYFVTQKLLWAHEFTTFPYKLFWWQAPDGSRLLTYFPRDYAGGIEGPGMAKDLSVSGPTARPKSAPVFEAEICDFPREPDRAARSARVRAAHGIGRIKRSYSPWHLYIRNDDNCVAIGLWIDARRDTRSPDRCLDREQLVEPRFPDAFNDRAGRGRLLCGADSSVARRDVGSYAHSTYG